MKLSFHGAARNVTGSCFHLEANGARLLIDCGFYQERNLRGRNFEPFPFAANQIDAVLLTHGHLDHCGLIPKLVKHGFSGPVYCTAPTGEIAGIIMLDSAKIQAEDLAFKRKRHAREGRADPHPLVPVYTAEDAEAAIRLIKPRAYNAPFVVADGVEAAFHNAGHILGSASLRLSVREGETTRSILFSGDLGRYDSPIICDPAGVQQADYVVVESTYGNRTHGPAEDIPGALADIINATRQAGGNLVIPSFAVERTQDLLYYMSVLIREKRIPRIMAFVDSPMAIKVTKVFRKYPELFDAESAALLERGEHPCDFPGLKMSRSVDESKAINEIHGTAIIIAGSGMCTGGRIKHHLRNNISRPESTVLFVGYQAVGTLGRIIVDGADRIRLFGEQQAVKARIERLSGFSAHGDKHELLRWLSSLQEAPRRVFVVHGESDASDAFADLLREKHGWRADVAEYGATEVLD